MIFETIVFAVGVLAGWKVRGWFAKGDKGDYYDGYVHGLEEERAWGKRSA